ncbi:hypothetical protein L218DRAFT_958334 [Marasmius fiardii PR-910]|nr:hypothetical protein L218DRAFT_958334 [Marasmius fiardii PR-910]
MRSPFIREAINQPQDFSQVWTFNFLQILALVLNVVVLSTAVISSHVKRAPIWFIFMASWMLWAIAHSLLFLSGHQFDDKPPPQALCLIQAGLVYAFPPYMELLNLGLLAHVYLVFRNSIKHPPRPQTETPLIFIFLPIGVFLAMFVEVSAIGLRYPEMIARMPLSMYCHLIDRSSFTMSAVFCALAILFSLGLQVVLGAMLYRNWEIFRDTHLVWGNGTTVFRIIVFSVGPTLALIINIVAEMSSKYEFASIIVIHLMPSIAAITFGSHKDIIRAWCCSGRHGNHDASYCMPCRENTPCLMEPSSPHR